MSNSKTNRANKGESCILLPQDYTVLEVKLTGFYSGHDEIIEVAALRVRNDDLIDTFESLSQISRMLDSSFIENTGITDDLLSEAPSVNLVIDQLTDFIGNDIIVGHNAGMYVNFVYDVSEKYTSKVFANDYINTTRIAKKLYPELETHRTNELAVAKNIKLESQNYRALSDAKLTYELFKIMKVDAINKFGDEKTFTQAFSKRLYSKIKAADIVSTKVDFDKTHPLFHSNVAFTGNLERFIRAEAFQIVADFGGIPSGNVTKKTKYLVLAQDAYTATPSGKSKKHMTAEKYAASGQDITILPEDVFYDMVFGD
ncbi:MAG: exonuclease domain-containing protein [Culicoidibacterales bacterium]